MYPILDKSIGKAASEMLEEMEEKNDMSEKDYLLIAFQNLLRAYCLHIKEMGDVPEVKKIPKIIETSG